jgi:hypothetical protein
VGRRVADDKGFDICDFHKRLVWYLTVG